MKKVGYWSILATKELMTESTYGGTIIGGRKAIHQSVQDEVHELVRLQ
ncbi:hypothetical protein V1502_18465 [Bacillus sp. SCS-153A]